jgi:hypothetical protein
MQKHCTGAKPRCQADVAPIAKGESPKEALGVNCSVKTDARPIGGIPSGKQSEQAKQGA